MVRKIFLLAILSSLTFIGFPSQSSHGQYANLDIEKSIFSMLCNGNLGTAFYIGNNLFVTNVHVAIPSFILTTDTSVPIEEIVKQNPKTKKNISESCFIRYKGARSLESIYAIDFTNDLIVLRMKEQDLKGIKQEIIPLGLGNFDPNNIKNKISLYGFPGNLYNPTNPQLRYEEINPEDVTAVDSNTIEAFIKWPRVRGASGSPLLMDGKVIGILHSAMETILTRSTTSTHLKKALKNPIKKPYLTLYGVVKDFLSWKKNAHANFMQDSRPFLVAFLQERTLSENPQDIPKEYVEKLNKLLESDPRSSTFWSHFLIYHSALGDDDEISNAIERYSAELEAISHPAVSFHIGFHYIRLNDVQKSVDYFNKSSNQGMGSSQYIVALCHFANTDFTKYENSIQKAILKGIPVAQFHFKVYNLSREEKMHEDSGALSHPSLNEPKNLMEIFTLKWRALMPDNASEFPDILSKYLENNKSLVCERED